MVESRDKPMDPAYIRWPAEFTAHFPVWAFERYLREVERKGAREDVR